MISKAKAAQALYSTFAQEQVGGRGAAAAATAVPCSAAILALQGRNSQLWWAQAAISLVPAPLLPMPLSFDACTLTAGGPHF